MKRKLIVVALLSGLALCAHFLFITYDNRFPYGRMWETPGVRPHEESTPYMASGRVPWEGGEAEYRTVPGENLLSPVSCNNPDAVAKGREGYHTFCVQCHGKYHDGNGTVGQSFAPLPGDLRSERIQSLADGIIFREISDGKPGGRQPALATTIAVDDRWRIIAYLKSLGAR